MGQTPYLASVKSANTHDGPAIVHDSRGSALCLREYDVDEVLCIRDHLDGFEVVQNHGAACAGTLDAAYFL